MDLIVSLVLWHVVFHSVDGEAGALQSLGNPPQRGPDVRMLVLVLWKMGEKKRLLSNALYDDLGDSILKN